jgi:hypothetical protein
VRILSDLSIIIVLVCQSFKGELTSTPSNYSIKQKGNEYYQTHSVEPELSGYPNWVSTQQKQTNKQTRKQRKLQTDFLDENRCKSSQ